MQTLMQLERTHCSDHYSIIVPIPNLLLLIVYLFSSLNCYSRSHSVCGGGINVFIGIDMSRLKNVRAHSGCGRVHLRRGELESE